ncbi:hypothetical protein EPI10_031319 [Gossypium australe]|uniref:Uncharacterized protein n=1 Tax=Gossypium australe TaxID=47621 RepID=A0A5B6WZY7_9ROSI|nr:hypothetical protein EPI10_031319 [Gossypium australe]
MRKFRGKMIKKNEARIAIEARAKSWTKLIIFIHFSRQANSWIIDVGTQNTLSITILGGNWLGKKASKCPHE